MERTYLDRTPYWLMNAWSSGWWVVVRHVKVRVVSDHESGENRRVSIVYIIICLVSIKLEFMFWYSFPLPKGLSLAETQRAQSFFYLRALVILAAWREAALFFISRKAAKDAKFFILSVLAILAALREAVLFNLSQSRKGRKVFYFKCLGDIGGSA